MFVGILMWELEWMMEIFYIDLNKIVKNGFFCISVLFLFIVFNSYMWIVIILVVWFIDNLCIFIFEVIIVCIRILYVKFFCFYVRSVIKIVFDFSILFFCKVVVELVFFWLICLRMCELLVEFWDVFCVFLNIFKGIWFF